MPSYPKVPLKMIVAIQTATVRESSDSLVSPNHRHCLAMVVDRARGRPRTRQRQIMSRCRIHPRCESPHCSRSSLGCTSSSMVIIMRMQITRQHNTHDITTSSNILIAEMFPERQMTFLVRTPDLCPRPQRAIKMSRGLLLDPRTSRNSRSVIAQQIHRRTRLPVLITRRGNLQRITWHKRIDRQTLILHL